MFGFFRKKRKAIPPQPSPPWVKWALIGFVALALIGNLRKGTPDAPNKVHEAFHQAAENLNPKKFFNLAEYKSVLFPGGELRIRDIKEGKGPSAICGQEVKIAYEAFIDKDKKIDDAATKVVKVEILMRMTVLPFVITEKTVALHKYAMFTTK